MKLYNFKVIKDDKLRREVDTKELKYRELIQFIKEIFTGEYEITIHLKK